MAASKLGGGSAPAGEPPTLDRSATAGASPTLQPANFLFQQDKKLSTKDYQQVTIEEPEGNPKELSHEVLPCDEETKMAVVRRAGSPMRWHQYKAPHTVLVTPEFPTVLVGRGFLWYDTRNDEVAYVVPNSREMRAGGATAEEIQTTALAAGHGRPQAPPPRAARGTVTEFHDMAAGGIWAQSLRRGTSIGTKLTTPR